MFEIINHAMIYLLDVLKNLTGSYGWAIILITTLIRGVLWPMNSAQTRSMRAMQELQPKLKKLQEQHKDSPHKLQEAMLRFYAEHKFNPFAGCLPLIVQIPIFIGLYGAINSPEFLARAGNESFYFLNSLHHTLQSHAGKTFDGHFNVLPNDTFVTVHQADVVLKTGKTLSFTIHDPNKAILVSPKPLIPGEPAELAIDFSQLGLSADYTDRIASMTLPIANQQTKELEDVQFTPQGTQLISSVATMAGQNKLNIDMLVMILIYGVLTLLYQRLMQQGSAATATANADPTQAMMMKLMPILFVGMLFFIPIPAGVMLYLLVTMAMMFIQTWWVQWSDSRQKAADAASSKNSGSTPPPNLKVIDVKAE